MKFRYKVFINGVCQAYMVNGNDASKWVMDMRNNFDLRYNKVYLENV